MKMSHGLTASLILLLSGCAHMQPATTDNRSSTSAPAASARSAADSDCRTCPCTGVTSDADTDRILAFYTRFHQLPAIQQTQEYENLSHIHKREPSLTSAYRLALVLLTPDRGFSDPERARKLLDLNNEDQAPAAEVKALGRILYVLSAENQRLQLRLNREEERATALKLQLEELINIETIIKERHINSTPDTGL